ncbi:hypothetical protein D3C87_1406200 [compost metagenome]
MLDRFYPLICDTNVLADCVVVLLVLESHRSEIALPLSVDLDLFSHLRLEGIERLTGRLQVLDHQFTDVNNRILEPAHHTFGFAVVVWIQQFSVRRQFRQKITEFGKLRSGNFRCDVVHSRRNARWQICTQLFDVFIRHWQCDLASTYDFLTSGRKYATVAVWHGRWNLMTLSLQSLLTDNSIRYSGLGIGSLLAEWRRSLNIRRHVNPRQVVDSLDDILRDLHIQSRVI